jgi:hypothetical protein
MKPMMLLHQGAASCMSHRYHDLALYQALIMNESFDESKAIDSATFFVADAVPPSFKNTGMVAPSPVPRPQSSAKLLPITGAAASDLTPKHPFHIFHSHHIPGLHTAPIHNRSQYIQQIHRLTPLLFTLMTPNTLLMAAANNRRRATASKVTPWETSHIGSVTVFSALLSSGN